MKILLKVLEHESVIKYIQENMDGGYNSIKYNEHLLYLYVESHIDNFVDINSIDNTYNNIKYFTISHITESAEDAFSTMASLSMVFYVVKKSFETFVNSAQDSVIKELYNDLTGGSSMLKGSKIMLSHFKLGPGVSYEDFATVFKKVRSSGNYMEFLDILKIKRPGGFYNYYFADIRDFDKSDAMKKFNELFSTKYQNLEELVKSKQFTWWVRKVQIPRVSSANWEDLPNRVIPNSLKEKIADSFGKLSYNIKSGIGDGLSNTGRAISELIPNTFVNSGRIIGKAAETGFHTLFNASTAKGVLAIGAIAGLTKLLLQADFEKYEQDAKNMISSLNSNDTSKALEIAKSSDVVKTIITKDPITGKNALTTVMQGRPYTPTPEETQYWDAQFDKLISGKSSELLPAIPVRITNANVDGSIWDKAREVAIQYGGIYGIVILLLTIGGLLLYKIKGVTKNEKKSK